MKFHQLYLNCPPFLLFQVPLLLNLILAFPALYYVFVLDIHFLSGLFIDPCIVSQEFDIWSLNSNESTYINDKQLIKVVDILGRDIRKEQKNQTIFYIYNDGSVEKRYNK